MKPHLSCTSAYLLNFIFSNFKIKQYKSDNIMGNIDLSLSIIAVDFF